MQATAVFFTETQPVTWQARQFDLTGYLQTSNTVLPDRASGGGREREFICWLLPVSCLQLVTICPMGELTLAAVQKVRSHILLGSLSESGSRNGGRSSQL